VHQADGETAEERTPLVLSVLFLHGASNAALASINAELPEKLGAENAAKLETPFDLSSLLPGKANRKYYSYEGSLSVPPCTEGVRRVVLHHFLEADEAEIGHISSIVGHNARPLQPLNDRVVMRSSA